MPDMYCPVCDKKTAHKVIMTRCHSVEETSLVQKIWSMTSNMAKCISGQHYYQLEPQCFCRVCNHAKSIGEPHQAPSTPVATGLNFKQLQP